MGVRLPVQLNNQSVTRMGGTGGGLSGGEQGLGGGAGDGGGEGKGESAYETRYSPSAHAAYSVVSAE